MTLNIMNISNNIRHLSSCAVTLSLQMNFEGVTFV